MNTTVANFLTKHNFIFNEDVDTLSMSILSDMNAGLSGKESDEDMIKTFCLPPDEKIKNKSVIVIDAGGTNFRSCLVTFNADGNAEISDMEKTKMPGVEKELSKKDFFAQFAKNLEHLKNKADCIGFCFSYPVKITEDGDGILLGFSKEVKAPEVVGSKMGECLKAELKANGWNEVKKVTLLNDTTAALLAGHAIAKNGKAYSSYIGLILGTGLNAAYIQPKNEFMEKQIIVCEAGKTRAVSRSDFDVEFDKTTVTPGTFYMEKACSGGYLGPLTLHIIQAAAKEKIFSEKMAREILLLTSLTLIELDAYLHTPKNFDTTLGSIVKKCGNKEDAENLFEILDAIVERSARRASSIITACVKQSAEGKKAMSPVCILCNGTTFHKTYKIKERVIECLENTLTEKNNLFWELVAEDNDITLGTAIAGCL